MVASGPAQNPKLDLIEDNCGENRSKALIEFFNFSDRQALDLKTADKNVEILSDNAPFTLACRAVNPLAVKLAIADNELTLAEAAEVQLERGESYAVIASGKVENLKLTVTQSSVAR